MRPTIAELEDQAFYNDDYAEVPPLDIVAYNELRSCAESTLGTLKAARDAEAHTHIKGVTRRINAPSVTLCQFVAVYDGLVEVDSFLRRTGL